MSAKSQIFHFKQFSVDQTHSAMKVGTDGVLLGAWVNLETCEHFLDLGTGTGLIALMAAQRLQGKNFSVTAIEKDDNACCDALKNFEASPWGKRLTLIHDDIKKALPRFSGKFCHIVANPPYFEKAVPCKNEARDLARYVEDSHLDWLKWGAEALRVEGVISFVLPYEAGLKLLEESPLPCVRRTDVATKAGKPFQRMLLSFKKTARKVQTEHQSLTIYDENHQYTEEMAKLCRDFYLKL